nr:hypothetical protein [Pseudomonas sp. BIGb0427]
MAVSPRQRFATDADGLLVIIEAYLGMALNDQVQVYWGAGQAVLPSPIIITDKNLNQALFDNVPSRQDYQWHQRGLVRSTTCRGAGPVFGTVANQGSNGHCPVARIRIQANLDTRGLQPRWYRPI